MARIVLTLPRPRIGPFAEILREHGHEALELPFLALEPLVGASDGDSLRARLADCDWLVFVSPTAVEVVADAIDARWPSGPAVAIVGPGSLAALESRGATTGRRVLMPTGPVFDAAALLATDAMQAPVGARVLIVRARHGNRAIECELALRGASVQVLEAYERLPCAPDAMTTDRLLDWLADGEAATGRLLPGRDRPVPRLLVTTTESAQELADLAASEPRLHRLLDLDALAIHPRIAERLHALGWKTVIPVDPGVEALLRALESPNDATDPRPGAGREHRSGRKCD